MRIQCPSCSATYDVAEGLLEKPRTVRCAQCGHDWVASAMPEPDGSLAAPPAAVPPVDAPSAAATREQAPVAAEATNAPPPDVHAPAATHDAANPDLSFDEAHPHEPEPAPERPEQEEDEAADTPPLSGIARLSTDADPAGMSRRRDRLLAPAWIVSVSLLLAFCALGYVKRAQVMDHWPLSKRAYAVLGLTPAASDPAGERH